MRAIEICVQCRKDAIFFLRVLGKLEVLFCVTGKKEQYSYVGSHMEKKFNSFQFYVCWYFYRVSLLIHTFLLLCRLQMLLVVQQVHFASLLLEMSLCRARYQSL